MYFLTILVTLAVVAFMSAIGFRIYAESFVSAPNRGSWAIDATAVAVTALMLTFLAVRSPEFGVDTRAYIEQFMNLCERATPTDDISYVLSLRILDLISAGVCRAELVPAAWGVAFVGILLIAPANLSFKFRYVALLLVSMIGVELTTNALRQGLSVAVLVAAVAWSVRLRLLSLGLFVLSGLLHTSSLLIVVAYLLSSFGYGLFFIGFFSLALIVGHMLASGAVLALAAPFLYEISKYMAHESDEIYVRLLAVASLLAVLIMPLVGCSDRKNRWRLLSSSEYGRAVRLGLTAIPFLLLPYFGYRYVYGIMPIVLWLALSASSRLGVSSGRTAILVAVVNLIILLVWSGGSSYMRRIPFLVS